jgi:hypothetical protein
MRSLKAQSGAGCVWRSKSWGRASVSPESVSGIAYSSEPRDGGMRGGNVGLAQVRENLAHCHSRVEDNNAHLAATLDAD